jgi:hypothetical protein
MKYCEPVSPVRELEGSPMGRNICKSSMQRLEIQFWRSKRPASLDVLSLHTVCHAFAHARRRTPLSVGICSITTGVEEESCRRGILLGQYHNDLGYTGSNVELVKEIFILSYFI